MSDEIPVGDEQEGCDVKTAKEYAELKKSLKRVLKMVKSNRIYEEKDFKAVEIVEEFVKTF
jgi:hypothetical protein